MKNENKNFCSGRKVKTPLSTNDNCPVTFFVWKDMSHWNIKYKTINQKKEIVSETDRREKKDHSEMFLKPGLLDNCGKQQQKTNVRKNKIFFLGETISWGNKIYKR